MRIEVLNTGTELLLGHTVNTHAAWIGRALFPLGLRIARQSTVPDGEAIREAMVEAMDRCDALIVTGGLGPTSDDLTREITGQVLGIELIHDEAALRSIEAFFALRGRPVAEANWKQALCPVGADVLPNPNGTAPGLYVPPRLNGRSRCALFLLPGPPRELYPMFESEVVPRLRALSGIECPPSVLALKFTGIGESDFHQGVDAELAKLTGLEFGYCAHIAELDLRLIGEPAVLERARGLVMKQFAPYVISEDGSSMEERVVRLAIERNRRLSVAESCTGGLVSHRLTNVAGASHVFDCGYTTYANQAKIDHLGVSPATLEHHGAVSEPVAVEMAEGVLRASGADLAVAVTGIAGPGGGVEGKPVGTAWIGVASRGALPTAFKVFHPRNRHDFKWAVSQAALDALRRKLMGS